MNIKNFLAVLDYIETHPEQWDQRMWVGIPSWLRGDGKCGAACCIAGWAQILSGRDADSVFVISDASAHFEIEPKVSKWLFNSWRTLADFQTVRRVYGRYQGMAL